ncbi:hypothetical protein XELAEV_18001280mg [Xenopus laevis]|uniref:Uncharacterized protein n=1 Tax=Xenopus laevis TaxID=8355 RepID=A0A974BP00_XENLA|nr:hypothetical protein XELAEV_18001280mg [Xenopus laevis]
MKGNLGVQASIFGLLKQTQLLKSPKSQWVMATNRKHTWGKVSTMAAKVPPLTSIALCLLCLTMDGT